jgi:thiamine-monophosphate kinase
MALGEFELIGKYFSTAGAGREDVVLGVGDDAALVRVPSGHELVVAADTIVSGVHFPADLPAAAIGYRALAVNLSDMAAMGATPAWFTLALTMPKAEESWLAQFSGGLLELAAQHQVALIGGDTTGGPLTVSVQILGLAPAGMAIRRSGARAGDLVCLSGAVGDAAAGLQLLLDSERAASAEDRAYLIDRFVRPTPRVSLGLLLRDIATAAIDLSDGLLADLGKLAAASGMGARLELERLPLSPALVRCAGAEEGARNCALQGGDDYELCFTVPAANFESLRRSLEVAGHSIHAIGVIEPQPGVRCYDHGDPVDLELTGYDHFRS